MITVRNIPIDKIGLSARSSNALRRIDVHTVGDLLTYDEEKLLQIRNLGQKSVNEILKKIEQYKDLGETTSIDAEPGNQDKNALPRTDDKKEHILKWLQDEQIHISELELLSTKAYNLLLINEREYLYQIAFQAKEDLLQLLRMDNPCAEEIVRYTDEYIQCHCDSILAALDGDDVPPLTLNDMRFMPKYQADILEFVRRNDVPVENMAISARPKNQLRNNGYCKLSEIIFLTEDQLKMLRSMGSNSVAQVQEMIHDYLKKNETQLLALCNGDLTAIWNDHEIRNKILKLYHAMPFSGFNFKEMTQKLELPQDFPAQRIKEVIDALLVEQKLEYRDFRYYRLYEKFESFLSDCDKIDERSRNILQLRLQGVTLEEIAQKYDLTRERVRQLIKKKTAVVRSQHAVTTGDCWFDEDYYRYFYENYAFDWREASVWMGISEAVWWYLDMIGATAGGKDLQSALDDHDNLETNLHLKIKKYLNRNKILVDGIWIEKKRHELEPIIARKICQDQISFEMFAKAYNDYLTAEGIPYDEELYYTDTVIRTRKNRLAASRFLLWKLNEQLRYYDIDSRDYTELLEALKLDVYENVDYSTLKFTREHPDLMKKYDIRDQYELHNLLKKIIPEGSFHDFHCGRTPMIKFGIFDRDSAILDIIINHAPISIEALCELIYEEYGYDSGITRCYLAPFKAYYHNGIYTVDQTVMPGDRLNALCNTLTEDFYYIDEIRKQHAKLFPEVDPEEINPYNLKSMGFTVLSRYVLRNYPTLEAYCDDLLTAEDIVDLKPLRQRLTYVQMFSQKLMELKRNLDVIEFEPGQLLNFRKLARAGITKADIRAFCQAVYHFLPEGSYFSAQSLRQNGFTSELFDLGFSDWFYANLLLSDDRFSFTHVFNNLVLHKGAADITIQSFLVDRVCSHGCIDTYDLMTELAEHYGCPADEKSDITYRLKNTQVYHDKDLDRLYANVELYYQDLDETEGY